MTPTPDETEKNVALQGGPFDGQSVDPRTLATFGVIATHGDPVNYIVPIDEAESAVYGWASRGVLQYLYTMSDQ